MRRHALLLLGLLACTRREPERAPEPAQPASTAVSAAILPSAPATYVGSERCKDCHAQAYAAWHRSQHRMAMQVPSTESVLGDFADGQLSFRGERTRFLREAGGYRIEARGVTRQAGQVTPENRRFEVKYTFGVTPLQQYLLDVGDGHLQASTAAYDTRPKEQGGGRWYQLQPEERTQPGDELHWTAAVYNWNSACADCHSTNLQKGYDAGRQSYATTFSELSVGCEACHGPASRHVEQAGARAFDARRGLERQFASAQQRQWSFAPGKSIASLSPLPNAGTSQVDACASCHSHRVELGGSGLAFHDRYRLDLLTSELYHPDGQQKLETFEVGSFLQSKMHAAGVVCSDCHEPHAGQLRRPGNALCSGCHDAKRYDAPTHHLHPGGGASECVQCHMPTRTFMEIDARREHRFAVPRPDLTLTLGVPNPCTESCHLERRKPGGKGGDAAAGWAAGVIRERFGPQRAPSFAPALHAGRTLSARGQQELLELAQNPQFPAIARASALAELGAYPQTPVGRIVGLSRDASPLVRRALAQLFAARPGPESQSALVALLNDEARSVRIEATRGLLEAPRGSLSESERSALQRGLVELRASLEHNADRPGAVLELARLELREAAGKASAKAEALFKRALALDANFAASYLNYADHLRQQKREGEARALLEQGLRKSRDHAPLEHALGLALIRGGDKAGGLAHLGRAHRLAPSSNRLTYVYAVALFDAGRREQAISLLEKLHQQAPGDQAALELLARYARLTGAVARADELDLELARARAGQP